jgi:hypothetical protein
VRVSSRTFESLRHTQQYARLAASFSSCNTVGTSTPAPPPAPTLLHAAFAQPGSGLAQLRLRSCPPCFTLLTALWRSQDPSHYKLSTFNEGPERRLGDPENGTTLIACPHLFSKTSFTTLWLGICYNFISPSKSSHRFRNVQKPSTLSTERKKGC